MPRVLSLTDKNQPTLTLTTLSISLVFAKGFYMIAGTGNIHIKKSQKVLLHNSVALQIRLGTSRFTAFLDF